MRLSFRKIVLLFSTIALGSMLGASAQDNVLAEGYIFEQDWKSEAVPKTNPTEPWAHYRQGFGKNNQFFIQNKDQNNGGKIEIYDKNGYVSDFHESGYGSNFTHDEAGNMIVRVSYYGMAYDWDDEFMLIKADGSATSTIYLPEDDDCIDRRGDYFGFAQGDVFSAQGGKLLITGSNLEYIYLIVIKNGQISETHRIQRDFYFNEDPRLFFSADDYISHWKDARGNDHFFVGHRSEKPVDITIDETNWTMHSTTIDYTTCAYYGTSNGSYPFAFNGKNYLMFSTRPNWNDGFAIAELGTNADGTLDGTISMVARHMNDYPTPMLPSQSSQCNWLNWEPRDEKSIYIYQYFAGFYMARYIFGIKTDETTLADIVNDGTVGESYTVADDILGVYIAVEDPKCVYAKDLGKHRNPSVKKSSEIDFVANQVDDNNVKLQPDEWDQSNWVLLQFTSEEEALKFAGKKGEPGSRPIACKVIKGGTLTGTLTSKLNPTMTVTSYVKPTETQDYVENNYLPCNFMTPNVQSNIFYHGVTGDYFFIEPKPQEYVKVWWATYDGDDHFSVRTSSQFKGSFNVDWSLYPGEYTKDFVKDNGYSFHAIVRYVTPSEQVQPLYPKADYSDMVKEGNYMVFPLEGGAAVFTGIENVHADLGNVLSVTYVNMLGIESPTPFSGINIVVTKYENGTRITKSMK